MPDKKIDDLDIKIIRLLQQDARASLKDIASQCKTSSDTIKNRFNTMKKNGTLLGSTIVIDPKKIGEGNLVMVGIKIVQPYSDSIISMIKKISGACIVTRAIGKYDIEAIFILRDIERIGTTKETIEDLPQVKSVNVGIFVDKPLLCPKNFEFK